jgi:hypothetical protein
MAGLISKLSGLLGFAAPASSIPPFRTYYPSQDGMNPEQRAFYELLVRSWRSGMPIPVDGNISYVFCLAYELIQQQDKSKAARELLALADVYRQEPKIAEYCLSWAADCYVALGDYEAALKVFPPVQLDGRASTTTDRLLNIKFKARAPVAGADVLTLFGPKVTKYVKQHVASIARYLDSHLAALAERQGPLLETWTKDLTTPQQPMGLFSGVPLREPHQQPLAYGFSYNPNIETFCANLTRDAENTLREDEGLPRVGEGWIEETRLYYALREHFSGTEVEQHARPDWLGNQHLDVFFPALSVAIEYQGAQHDKPVAYFGGDEAFAKTKERDARKRSLCAKHSVHLIEVRPGYVLETLVADIKGYSPER